jgi:chromosome segregation ATPase
VTEATTDAAEATSRALSERVAPLEGGLAQQSFVQEDLEGRMHEVRAAIEEVTSHVQSQLEHMHRALQQEQHDATTAVQVRLSSGRIEILSLSSSAVSRKAAPPAYFAGERAQRQVDDACQTVHRVVVERCDRLRAELTVEAAKISSAEASARQAAAAAADVEQRCGAAETQLSAHAAARSALDERLAAVRACLRNVEEALVRKADDQDVQALRRDKVSE